MATIVNGRTYAWADITVTLDGAQYDVVPLEMSYDPPKHDTIPAPPLLEERNVALDFHELGEALFREQVANGGQESEEAREACYAFVCSELLRVANLTQQIEMNLHRVHHALHRDVEVWDVCSAMYDVR